MSGLTPAEELGLSGLNLDSRVRKVFYGLPPETIARLMQRMTDESIKRSLIYSHEGHAEAIRVFLRPTGVMPAQLAYLHYVSLTILNALKRLPELYVQDFAVREVVPLTPDEEKWLWDSWGPSLRENNPVFGRLDAVVEFTSPMWKNSLHYLEPNLGGVGGIHLGPTCDQLLADIVVPVIADIDPQLKMEVGRDLRELFIQELLDHLEAIGREGRNICFIEPKYASEGPVEQRPLAEYYAKHGMTTMHADPSELYLQKGEVMYDGKVVDIAYRDYEVRDLVALGEVGVDLAPIRKLFKDNRIVSSMVGEFDHKSAWEILTDPQFTQKYFNAEERRIFRRHILWTRRLTDRNTTLPDGEVGDLLEYARKEHDFLVLKPNRSYGGEGVIIGHSVSTAEWEGAIENALAAPDAWVVQRLASIPVSEFPVLDDNGAVHVEPFFVVMGFAPTRYGLSIVGRASQKEVVNVKQRGGMCGVLIGHPPGPLVGPAEAQRIGWEL